MLVKKAFHLRRLFTGILMTIFLLPYATASAQDCTFMWSLINHEPYVSKAYPEWNSIYWSYTFRKWQSPYKKLTLTGIFPHARYMSFVLYNIKDGNPVDQLLDVDIQPDEGSVNPYLPNTPRTDIDEHGNPIDRNYTVNVVQEGSPDQDKSNTMVIPSDVKNVVILLRIYLPDDGITPPYDNKFLKPTSVIASSELLGTETNCPGIFPSESLDESLKTPEDAPTLDQISDQIIWSFRPGKVGLYPNGDNQYLVAPLQPAPNGKFALIHFLPPKYTQTKNGTNMFTGDEEVRYWSVCLSNLADTTTSEYCFADEDLTIDEDGYVRIAVASEEFVKDKSVEEKWKGWNFIPWAGQERPALLFRQLEAIDFAGSFNKVNRPDTPEEIEALENAESAEDILPFAAHYYKNVGEYGPHGIYCSEDEFRANACLIEP